MSTYNWLDFASTKTSTSYTLKSPRSLMGSIFYIGSLKKKKKKTPLGCCTPMSGHFVMIIPPLYWIILVKRILLSLSTIHLPVSANQLVYCMGFDTSMVGHGCQSKHNTTTLLLFNKVIVQKVKIKMKLTLLSHVGLNFYLYLVWDFCVGWLESTWEQTLDMVVYGVFRVGLDPLMLMQLNMGHHLVFSGVCNPLGGNLCGWKVSIGVKWTPPSCGSK